MIFEALQSELFRFNFDKVSKEIKKIPEFNLIIVLLFVECFAYFAGNIPGAVSLQNRLRREHSRHSHDRCLFRGKDPFRDDADTRVRSMNVSKSVSEVLDMPMSEVMTLPCFVSELRTPKSQKILCPCPSLLRTRTWIWTHVRSRVRVRSTLDSLP